MCDPISGSMAALSVLQVQQQQQAADAQANAINSAFEENNQMQIDSYNKDMEAYWDEELGIQQAMHDNAEDAAEATLALKVQQKSDESSMLIANAEQTPGGGGSPTALLGNLRRSQMNTARDLDDEFQAGVVALGGEKAALQRDKVARRNQAIGAINSAPRESYQSGQSKMLALGMAGASAYVQGQGMQGKPLFGDFGMSSTATTVAQSATMTRQQRNQFSSMRGSGYRRNSAQNNPSATSHMRSRSTPRRRRTPYQAIQSEHH